jgi:MerR family transcriptional regulator, thiopeptide resistance regulator
MKRYTVKQTARLSGVSVRTLHHYDELGLLKPAEIGANGYRYYGREELLRLQQILLHRELEFPLEAIRAVLAAPDFDRAEVLRRHRATLNAQAQRYRRLIRTLDETLAAIEGETAMTDKDLYEGFAPEKQAEYEDWLVDRHGEGMREKIDETRKRVKGWNKADMEEIQAESVAVEQALGSALRKGEPADSAAVQALIRRHHAWVSRFWTPNRTAYIGLGRLYLEHPDFTARYEAVAPGLTEYMAEAMRVFAERELAA